MRAGKCGLDQVPGLLYIALSLYLPVNRIPKPYKKYRANKIVEKYF